MFVNSSKIDEMSGVGSVARELRSAADSTEDMTASVAAIIDAVRARGDAALVEMTEQFDGVRFEAGGLEVSRREVDKALTSLEAPARAAMEKAAGRIKAFAEKSLAQDWSYQPEPGVTVGQVRRPLERVGVYIPGGRFPYPSTVLMTGIPARVAGVDEIVFCVPPGADGSVNPVTLAAAGLVGGYRVFKVGGAQAIAAMAYGTETVPRCLMIAGPGNRYVAAAKRIVSEYVTVDLEAGPSEVVIYADDSAPPEYVAADLLAQLEHDPLALAVLVSSSADIIGEVRRSLEAVEGAEGSVTLVLCATAEQCVELANALAPEHLELMVDDAAKLLPSIRSAGCVFIGSASAVALGDYVAGPSHVLPTGGTASRLSGLRAEDFTHVMNVISYTSDGLESDAGAAVTLASLEGLAGHARSVEVRRNGPDQQAEV